MGRGLDLKYAKFFEKVADENLSAFRKTTPNHGFYGSKRVDNYVRERGKEKEGTAEGKKRTISIFCLYIVNFRDKKHFALHSQRNKMRARFRVAE